MIPLDPTRYVSDGTIIQVQFCGGPDIAKYGKYVKNDIFMKTCLLEVVDNRIYPKDMDKYDKSIIMARYIDDKSGMAKYNDYVEVIYPRDKVMVIEPHDNLIV